MKKEKAIKFEGEDMIEISDENVERIPKSELEKRKVEIDRLLSLFDK